MVPRVLCVAGLAGALQTPSFYREAAKRAGTPAFYGASTDGRVLDEPRPLIIGVAGGTASGKTALTERVVEQLNGEDIVSITQDSFYRDLSDDQLARVADINFDAPAAFDFDHCVDVLARLRRGEAGVRVPTYDFVANARRPAREDVVVGGVPRIVVFEGILALWDARLRDQFDIKIFVDADPDVRLARRIKRDIACRGRDLDGVLAQYMTFVKPAFDEFILPTKAHADVVIPRGAENAVAIDLLVRGIRERTMERAALGVAALEPRARSAADAFLV
jgi:uridine kinase